MANSLIAFLKKFREISPADEAIIAAACKQKTYKENDYLFTGGKICREIFFVYKGVLRIMTLNENGKELTHFFVPENRFCSILNSFTNQVPAAENIVAACDAEVLVITYTRLRQLYIQLPYLEPLIMKIIQQALLDKIAVKNSCLGRDSSTRYEMFVTKQPDVAHRVSLTDVASYLGITLQSLSRIRKNNK
jgi:CRP-like cAMP-binding protein